MYVSFWVCFMYTHIPLLNISMHHDEHNNLFILMYFNLFYFILLYYECLSNTVMITVMSIKLCWVWLSFGERDLCTVKQKQWTREILNKPAALNLIGIDVLVSRVMVKTFDQSIFFSPWQQLSQTTKWIIKKWIKVNDMPICAMQERDCVQPAL